MSQAQIVPDDSGVLHTNNAQLVSIGDDYQTLVPPAGDPTQLPQGETQYQGEKQQHDSSVAPQPQISQLPELDEQGQQWWNQFQQYTGLTRDQFTQGVQQLQQLPNIQQFVQTQQREAQVQQLRSELPDFDTVMPIIAERFRQLPPQMQAALDNVDGAKLLYSQILAERQAQGTKVPGTQPPRFDRTQVPKTNNSQEPQFTRAQIQSMSDEDYAKNARAIQYAYENGLVR